MEALKLEDLLNYHSQPKAAPPPPEGEPSAEGEAPPEADAADGNRTPETDWEAYANGNMGGNADAQPSGGAADPDDMRDMYASPSKRAQTQAKFVARMNDMLASRGLQKLANDKTPKRWRADEDEMEELTYYWALYLEETGGNVPPWMMLILMIVLTYGLKIPDALKAKRQNNALKVVHRKDRKEDEEVEDLTDAQEEISDQELDEDLYLNDFNTLAKAHNLETIARADRTPVGSCVYHWYVHGENMGASYGSFNSTMEASKWAHLVRSWKLAGIDVSRITVKQ